MEIICDTINIFCMTKFRSVLLTPAVLVVLYFFLLNHLFKKINVYYLNPKKNCMIIFIYCVSYIVIITVNSDSKK